MTAHEVLPLHKLSTSDFNKSLYITNKQYVYKNINIALENISVIENHSQKPKNVKRLSIFTDCTNCTMHHINYILLRLYYTSMFLNSAICHY